MESKVPFSRVAGDEVDDSDSRLRTCLDREGIPHMLAVRSYRDAMAAKAEWASRMEYSSATGSIAAHQSPLPGISTSVSQCTIANKIWSSCGQ